MWNYEITYEIEGVEHITIVKRCYSEAHAEQKLSNYKDCFIKVKNIKKIDEQKYNQSKSNFIDFFENIIKK